MGRFLTVSAVATPTAPVTSEPSRVLSAALWISAAAALALAVNSVYLRVAVGAHSGDLHPSLVSSRIEQFQRNGLRTQVVLGTLAVLAGAAVLAIERRLATSRGMLRAAGVAAVLVSGMIALSITEPLASHLAAAAAAGMAIEPLFARWQFWLSVHAGLGIAALAAYAVAPLLPRLPAPAAVLTGSERRLLWLLGSATYFEGYDRFIVSLALPYIGRDIGAGESALGWALFWIRLGALLSLPLAWQADRRGRRQVLLLTVMGYTMATFATAFTTEITAFVVCQLLATVFLVAELSLAHVVIAEEFPAHLRGFGLGIIGAFGSLGAGAAAMLFPLLQATPLGWRGLYLIGIAPLLFITYLRRALPETRRWEAARASGLRSVRWRTLLHRPHLRPLLALIAIAAATTAAIAPAFSFFSYTATIRHTWSPTQVSMAIVVGGGIGILGWPVGGRLADALGRQVTGSVALGLTSAAVVLLYQGPAAWITPAFSLLIFAEACVATVVAALTTECFPTAVRSSAKAAVTNAAILGAMFGLAAVGALSQHLGGAGTVISILAALNAFSLLLLWTLGETAGADLDNLEARG